MIQNRVLRRILRPKIEWGEGGSKKEEAGEK
jgi:hypothetical protein